MSARKRVSLSLPSSCPLAVTSSSTKPVIILVHAPCADERIRELLWSDSLHVLLWTFEDILFVAQFPSAILTKQSISWLTGLNCFIVIVSWKTSTGRNNQLQFGHVSEGNRSHHFNLTSLQISTVNYYWYDKDFSFTQFTHHFPFEWDF